MSSNENNCIECKYCSYDLKEVMLYRMGQLTRDDCIEIRCDNGPAQDIKLSTIVEVECSGFVPRTKYATE